MFLDCRSDACPGWDVCRRQPIDIFLTWIFLSFITLFLPSTLSLNQWKKYCWVRINNIKKSWPVCAVVRALTHYTKGLWAQSPVKKTYWVADSFPALVSQGIWGGNQSKCPWKSWRAKLTKRPAFADVSKLFFSSKIKGHPEKECTAILTITSGWGKEAQRST